MDVTRFVIPKLEKLGIKRFDIPESVI